MAGSEYDTSSDNKNRVADKAHTNDAQHVICGALAMGPIHNDGTWKYFGEAIPGTALNEAKWRVSRMNITDKQVQWADGDSFFDNLYTNYATVTGLSYS